MHKCKFAFCEEEKLHIIFTGSILSLCFCQISYILHKPSHERWVCSSVSVFWGGEGQDDIIYKWRQFLLAIKLKSRDLSHFAELKYMVLVEQGWRDMIWGFLRPERVKTLSFSCSEDKVSFKSRKICLCFKWLWLHSCVYSCIYLWPLFQSIWTFDCPRLGLTARIKLVFHAENIHGPKAMLYTVS